MITVVICSYNYGHLVAHAIESVLCQTKLPDQILVVDDGAHDGVDEVASLYGVDVLRRKDNMGIVANFNDVLFNHVRGDRVIFLGADNWLHPQTIEKLSAYQQDIVTYPITLWGTEATSFVAKNGIKVEQQNGYYIWSPDRPHGSSLYNVSLARQSGGYAGNPNSKKSEEDSMLFSAMLNNGASIAVHPEPLLYYRRHQRNFQEQ